MRRFGSPRACVRRPHREEPPPHRRWYRRRPSFTMAYGVDGAIDGILVDSPALSRSSRIGGFRAPLLVLLLGEQLVEQETIFRGKLLDPIEDLVDGCAAHESSEISVQHEDFKASWMVEAVGVEP